MLHVWYDEFIAAIGGGQTVHRYDPAAPMAEQFRGMETVVALTQAGVGTRPMIDAAVDGGVRLWQIMGTGLDHWDVGYFLERGLPFANAPGPTSAEALAEHALFLMLCFAKNLRQGQANVRSQIFYRPWSEELGGATLGLVGLGASARELARRAWPLGMRVVAVNRTPLPQPLLDELHIEYLGGLSRLQRLAATADYLSLHLALTDATRQIVNQRVLANLKPDSVLINVARGELIEEPALLEALEQGRLKGAGLDAFAPEPLALDHPFLHRDNVIVTGHVAGQTRGTARRRAEIAAENVIRVANGLPPLHQITAVP
jgi:phosphoglycerate dehydrogenase-like enzyme